MPNQQWQSTEGKAYVYTINLVYITLVEFATFNNSVNTNHVNSLHITVLINYENMLFTPKKLQHFITKTFIVQLKQPRQESRVQQLITENESTSL